MSDPTFESCISPIYYYYYLRRLGRLNDTQVIIFLCLCYIIWDISFRYNKLLHKIVPIPPIWEQYFCCCCYWGCCRGWWAALPSAHPSPAAARPSRAPSASRTGRRNQLSKYFFLTDQIFFWTKHSLNVKGFCSTMLMGPRLWVGTLTGTKLTGTFCGTCTV